MHVGEVSQSEAHDAEVTLVFLEDELLIVAGKYV